MNKDEGRLALDKAIEMMINRVTWGTEKITIVSNIPREGLVFRLDYKDWKPITYRLKIRQVRKQDNSGK